MIVKTGFGYLIFFNPFGEIDLNLLLATFSFVQDKLAWEGLRLRSA